MLPPFISLEFGRKDAFPGVETSKLAANSHFTENAGNNMSIQNGIQHPGSFYTWGSSWWSTPPTGYSYDNLWSADNTGVGLNDNSVVKTVYDPCPVGFKMPPTKAFSGFTSNGQNDGTMNVDGTDNLQTFQSNFGHNLWTSSSKTATINFPASGYRFNDDGSLLNVGVSGCYWSALPSDTDSGFYLGVSLSGVFPLNYNNQSYGFAVRPVSE